MELAFSFLLLLIFSGIHGEEEEQFICIKAGRYDNPTDHTCNSFYLCSFTLKGELIQTQYSCPEKSVFSPITATCSKNYTCPRVSRATRDLVEIETINNVHYECTTEIRGSYECKRSGKYADLTGSSCRTYYLCSLLQSRTYMKTKYECPEGTLFDPSAQKCHMSYECPCRGQSYRNNENSNGNSYREGERREHIGWEERYQWTDLFERWTERYSWTEIPKERTTRKQSTVQSTIWAGTDSCLELKNLDVFKCYEEGTFPDKRDATCTDYFLCTKLSNGGFLKTKYSCPYGTTYNPHLQRCSFKYVCPCQIGTVSTYLTTIPSKATTRQPSTTTTTYYSPTDHVTPLICGIPNEEFICSKSGRFPDGSDVSCNTYFYCEVDSKGFRRRRYRCPRCLTFDPSLEKCTDNYVCPCSFTEAPKKTSETNLYTSSTKSHTGQTKSTASTKGSSGTPSTGKTKPTTENPRSSTQKGSSTTNDCIVSPFSKPFRCSRKGRFADKRDLTCSSYFLCSELNNGTLIKTKYKCPKNSFFDPSIGRCSKKYDCPCSNLPVYTTKNPSSTSSKSTGGLSSTTSGKTINPTDVTKSTSEVSTGTPSTGKTKSSSGSESTENSTTESGKTKSTTPIKGSSGTPSTGKSKPTTENPSSSTQKGSSTTNDCVIPPSSKPFKCSSKGRYADKRDLTCSSYFLCSELNNSTFLKIHRRCPRNFLFDPSINKCSEEYECPCSLTSSTSSNDSSSTPSNPTEQPTSSTSSEPTGPGCPVLLPDYKFVCEEKGRFPDLLDLSCTSYFLCSQLPDGTFVQARYRCGNGLSFNPSTQTCSSSYKCPCSVTTSPTSSSQISSLSTTIPDFCQPTSEFVCTSVGRFPKPGDVSCCTYYSCSKSTNGTITQTEFSCPEGSSFDPVFRTCSDSYTCPCHITEPPEYFSTSSDNCLIPTEEFVCSSQGRFPNRQDVSCCNYFLCSDLGNGTFIKTEYNCPKGKSFDPELKRCTSSYICPCSITENPDTVVPTVPSTKPPTTEIITQPPECESSPLNPEHVCTSRGRFKDNKDITCSNYFLCSKLRNGTYIRTLYTCPRFSYFDPSIGMCTTTYKCPCISNFTTPSRSTGRITKIPGTRAPWHINTKRTTPATKPIECISVNPASGEIICPAEGKFLNPLDTKCTSYIHCVRKASVLVHTVVNCEGMTAFDVKLQKCSSNAVCILCP